MTLPKKQFWSTMDRRTNLKRTDKVMIGNDDDMSPNFVDLEEILSPLTTDDLPEGANNKYGGSGLSPDWLQLQANRVLSLNDAGLAIYNSSDNDYEVTIPSEADAAFGQEVAFSFWQEAVGKIKVKPAAGVTAPAFETVIQANEPLKPLTYLRRGPDNWICIGNGSEWIPNDPPTAPTISEISKTDTSVTIGITGATDDLAVTGYDVFIDNIIHETIGVVTEHTITGLSAQTSYAIKLQSKDGQLNSIDSNILNVITNSSELHIGPNAASDPAGNEADDIVGWSSSTNTIDITSVPTDGPSGSFMIRGVANQATTFARIGISFPVINGEQYNISWEGREGTGADARLYLFTNVTGSQISMTTSRASYSTAVTATSTGTATIQWVLVNSQVGHELFIDNLSITRV